MLMEYFRRPKTNQKTKLKLNDNHHNRTNKAEIQQVNQQYETKFLKAKLSSHLKSKLKRADVQERMGCEVYHNS